MLFWVTQFKSYECIASDSRADKYLNIIDSCCTYISILSPAYLSVEIVVKNVYSVGIKIFQEDELHSKIYVCCNLLLDRSSMCCAGDESCVDIRISHAQAGGRAYYRAPF